MIDTDLAWAAGFFDGEGYVTIGRSFSVANGVRYEGHYLRVGINHVAPHPLERFSRLFGGNVRYEQKVQGNRKNRTSWQLQETKAIAFLKSIYPYLYNKEKAADIAFEFAATKGTNGRRVTPDTRAKRDELKQKLMDLNAAD